MNVKQLNKYIEINKVLPLWKGMFKDSYRTELYDYSGNTSQKKNFTLSLNNYLCNIISKNDIEQEKYLQNYPTKIKFINNFDYNE